MKRYLMGFLFIILFVVVLGVSLSAKERITFLFIYLSYYIIFLLILLWGIAAFRLFKSLNLSARDVIRKHIKGFAAALLMTLIVLLTVQSDFRTLSDETNLLAVSKAIFAKKEIRNITQGKYYYDNFQPLNLESPKRPFVYPFLVSMVHSLIGFRASNGYIVNYIAFFCLLWGIFYVTERYTDGLSALSAQFLILSSPVITLYATCAGFDFINAFFFYLAFASLFFFLKKPSTEKFMFMWMNFLILSNTRYESVVYFMIMAIGLYLFQYLKWQAIKTHFTLFCITPILMLPFVWQRILESGKHENPPGVAPFSLGHFFNNFREFTLSQFDFSFYLPYANIVNLLSLICIGFLLYGLIKKWKTGEIERSTLHFFAFFGVAIAANIIILFCYYMGRYTHPVSARFFIIISLTLLFAPLLLKRINPRLLRSEALLFFSIAMFFLYHPIAIEDRFTNTLTLNREFRQARHFVNELSDKQILIIYHRPGQFTAMDFGAVDFTYANQNATSLIEEIQRGLFTDIIVMQKIQYSDLRPIDNCDLSEKFHLQELQKIQISGDFFLKISRVSNKQNIN